jgi:two-component system chemotaxis response regulator CheY
MLTTESSDEKKKAGKAAGATCWIVKLFNPELMLKVIAKVLPS